ncbi:MAG: choice-of-anchor Q domain-containing protein [Planctomycetota bacterium]
MHPRTRRLACLAAGLFVGSTALASDIWHVDIDAAPGGDGSSWATAFDSLQTALAVAGRGDEVWVAEGTYRPAESGGDRSNAFEVPRGVAIYGGFAGDELTRDQRDPGVNLTVLSGDLNGDDEPGFTNRSDNTYNVIRITGSYAFSRIDGVTVRGGHADGSEPRNQNGGGLLMGGSAPTLVNVTFRDNFAIADGGAIAGLASAPVLDRCTLVGNAAANGGALSASNGSVFAIESTFEGNAAADSGGAIAVFDSAYLRIDGGTVIANTAEAGRGGGIYISGGSILDFNTVETANNTADLAGGGVYVEGDSEAVLHRGSLNENSSEFGGGFAVGSDGEIEIELTRLSGNAARADGGAGYLFAGAGIRLADTSMLQNTAGNAGGGLANEGQSGMGLFNLFVTDNAAAIGGAISLAASTTATVEDSSFLRNSADDAGGALHVNDAILNLIRCDFSDNTAVNDGGAIALTAVRSFDAEDVQFDFNAGGMGGAVFSNIANRRLNFVNTVFSNNIASQDGGAVSSNDDSGVGFEAVDFVANSAGSRGGAASIFGSPWAFDAVRIESNTATSQGGGLYIAASSGTMNRVSFEQNSADVSGGGLVLVSLGESLDFEELRFIGNTAGETGGALRAFAVDREAEFINCLFKGNTAGASGAGAFVTEASRIEFINSTFLQNDAPVGRSVAADSVNQAGPSDVTISNSILWNGGDELLNADLSDFNTRYSNVEGGTAVGSNLNVPPLFADEFGRLDPGSPVIDAGSNFLLSSTIATDLDGNDRFVNDAGMPDTGAGSGDIIDMGAYEFQGRTVRLDLTITPTPLVAGSSAAFVAVGGTPGNEALLAYSQFGRGSTFIPEFEIAFDLDLAVKVGDPVVIDSSGIARWDLNIPTSGAGLNVWFQVAQFRNKSNVVETSIVQ